MGAVSAAAIMARGLLLLWLVAAATASERRKNKKKALKAAAGRPAAMTLGGLRLAKTGRGEHLLLRGEPGEN